MNALIFVSLLFYAITNIVCVASASCPCHIPCTGKPEVCTCFGPCGDDGYGCKGNGDDYEFLSQIKCGEDQWQVQCIRTASVSAKDILDDTNPFAAYEQAAQDNILEAFEDDADAADDDDIIDQQQENAASAQSMQWFGGNWFDFFGKNSDQFFAAENMENDNEDTKYMKAKYSQDFQDNDDQISIDNKDDFDFDSSMTPQSSQRTLKTSSKSSKKENEGPIYDDLGQNEAGYKIIAIPLYILIICIVSAAIGGMLMCAGFVYCGLHCCCPLPPSSPNITSQQRSHAVEMARVMRSLTLGGGSKSYDSEPGVYHRMGNYLHNPTNDEASSIASLSPLNRSKKDKVRRDNNKNDNDDEYANDSEDDKKENYVTRGNIDDMVDDYDYDENKEIDDDLMKNDYDQQPFALVGGGGESDIDNDSQSDDVMNEWSNLIEARLKIANDSYKDIDIEEPEQYNHKNQQEQEQVIEEEEEEEEEEMNNNQIENETEYDDDDDELRPLKSSKRNINNNEIQSEDMLGMVTVDRDSDDDEDDIDPDPECSETENEGLPLLNNNNNNNNQNVNE